VFGNTITQPECPAVEPNNGVPAREVETGRAVVDFEAFLADPANPQHLAVTRGSGGHFAPKHPGYETIAGGGRERLPQGFWFRCPYPVNRQARMICLCILTGGYLPRICSGSDMPYNLGAGAT
jgi:hypothetical protein